jgi:hypothetical protein
MAKVNFFSCYGDGIKTKKTATRERRKALAYINNSCIIRRYIFAAEVIINEIFRAFCGGMRRKKKSVLHLSAECALRDTHSLSCFPSGIHYVMV